MQHQQLVQAETVASVALRGGESGGVPPSHTRCPCEADTRPRPFFFGPVFFYFLRLWRWLVGSACCAKCSGYVVGVLFFFNCICCAVSERPYFLGFQHERRGVVRFGELHSGRVFLPVCGCFALYVGDNPRLKSSVPSLYDAMRSMVL